MTPQRILILVSILPFSVAVGCGDAATEARKSVADQLPVVAVEPVVALDFTERILATGELTARNHANIAAEVDGRVTQLRVDEGAAVARGAAVLELDPARRQLEHAAAKARVSELRAAAHEARREVRRRRELRKNDISSTAALEKAETQLRLAESRLDAALAEFGVAQRALAEATVRAPFSGLIVERKVSEGEYVQLGTPLFELVSLDPIEVVFSVAEVDSGRVHVGQHVAVSVAPYPEEEFAAVVDVVSPTIDPRTRTLRVKARIANAEGRLRPGLFARADLGVAKRTGVPVIPDIAVLQRTDGAVVFTFDPSTQRVARRTVEIGGFQEGKIEVASGLSPGELVLTRGHQNLIDGVAVRQLQGETPSVAAQGDPGVREAAEVSLQ